MPDQATPSPLTSLKPRKKLESTDIQAILEDMKAALRGAHALDYFERMEFNHDTRFAWWAGQTRDGRKWMNDERREAASRLMPGQTPKVFPWNGSSDVQERLVEKVIREHNTFKKLAVQRRQERIGPRDLSPDENPQAKAALWAQVSNYYQDITKREFRTAIAQWADISHEYGHSLLFVGWKSEPQMVERTIDAEKVREIVETAAVELAQQITAAEWLNNGGDAESVPELDAEQMVLIQDGASAKLDEMMEDDRQRAVLAAQLMRIDPEMPKDESMRVAKALKMGEPVTYYAVTLASDGPDFRALTYGVDVFFPATTTRVNKAPWICMPEWVTEVELKNRINNPHEAYDEDSVNEVLKHPGKAFTLSEFVTGSSVNWLLSGGHVRCGMSQDGVDDTNKKLFQILHVYYRASAVGNVQALYHSVLHGQVTDKALYHECCEHAHGRYPFVETLSDIEAPYLLAAEGYPEKRPTCQNEVKIHRDMRSDNASLTIKPPMKVPINQAGGRIDLSPGVQIPTRSTAGMGLLEPLKLGADARGSQEFEQTTLDAFNEYWARGSKVDPEVKLATRQVLISDFLTDVEAASVLTFQNIQEFAPDELRASFFGGLPVAMKATREEIQGMVSIELDYDVGELDPTLQDKRMKGLAMALQFDNQGLLNRAPILKAIVATYLPSHYKLLVADPNQQAKDEEANEQDILAKILSGTLFDERSSLVPGSNHALRLQVMQAIFGLQVDKKGEIIASTAKGPNGQPTRAQRLFTEDPEVQALVMNRLRFHAVQIQQMENAQTGKIGVEPVAEQDAPAVA